MYVKVEGAGTSCLYTYRYPVAGVVGAQYSQQGKFACAQCKPRSRNLQRRGNVDSATLDHCPCRYDITRSSSVLYVALKVEAMIVHSKITAITKTEANTLYTRDLYSVFQEALEPLEIR